MYVSGSVGGLGQVYKIAPGGGSFTTFATGFTIPYGLAFSAAGDLYVADRGSVTIANGRIWKVTPSGTATVFASGLHDPMFIAFDAAGDLFLGEWNGRNLKRISPTGVVSMYAAGLGAVGEEVGGLQIMPSGDIYVGVGPNIKMVGPGGSPVSVVASGLVGIMGLHRNDDGSFFIARGALHDIWSVTSAGAGSKYTGWSISCLDGPIATASFNQPVSVRMRDGIMYIANRGCHRVRTIDLLGSVPVAPSTMGGVKSMFR
jgi:sugar lactone lactonase YvrE